MRIEIHEAVWLDAHQQFSLAEFADLSEMPEAELLQLIDCAALAPVDPKAAEAGFGGGFLMTATMAQCLRHDFDLDVGALVLPQLILHRIRDLEARCAPCGRSFRKVTSR